MNFTVIIWVIFWNCLLLNTFIRKSFFVTVITAISFSSSFSLSHSLYQVLGRVEHSICLLATLITPLTLPVVIQSTLFTKVTFTPSNNRIVENLSTHWTLDRQIIIII